jgi:hypothetical protein
MITFDLIPLIYLTELNWWEDEIMCRISTILYKIDCGRSSFGSLDEEGWAIDSDNDDSSLLQSIEQLRIRIIAKLGSANNKKQFDRLKYNPE